ncbi:hypothetical protein [Pseudofrankia inefficax]|uniref:hypothetical protein n=1 Tax=Pseudofrankia inefficax (strain DSM 45817 / CECT 9037 / DDB 130130 / EuI1c) TaxID=298654 RepID=UPI0012FE6DEA|nr:hypothetical protein [Pseudofrankia inefficax]
MAAVAPLDDLDPRAIGPYVLLGRLGDGGMGSVYLGRRADAAPTGDAGPELVAVKVIRAVWQAALPTVDPRPVPIS